VARLVRGVPRARGRRPRRRLRQRRAHAQGGTARTAGVRDGPRRDPAPRRGGRGPRARPQERARVRVGSGATVSVPRPELRRGALPRRDRAPPPAPGGAPGDPARAHAVGAPPGLWPEPRYRMAAEAAGRRALRVFRSRSQGRVHGGRIPRRAPRGRLRADRPAHARRLRHAVGGHDRRSRRRLAPPLRAAQPLEARRRARAPADSTGFRVVARLRP